MSEIFRHYIQFVNIIFCIYSVLYFMLSLIERYILKSRNFKNDIENENNEIKIFQNESQVIFDKLQHRIAIKKG